MTGCAGPTAGRSIGELYPGPPARWAGAQRRSRVGPSRCRATGAEKPSQAAQHGESAMINLYCAPCCAMHLDSGQSLAIHVRLSAAIRRRGIETWVRQKSGANSEGSSWVGVRETEVYGFWCYISLLWALWTATPHGSGKGVSRIYLPVDGRDKCFSLGFPH